MFYLLAAFKYLFKCFPEFVLRVITVFFKIFFSYLPVLEIDSALFVSDYIIEDLSYDAVPAIAGNQDLLDAFKEDHIRFSYDYDPDQYTGFRRFNFSYYTAQQYFGQE